MPLSSVVGAQSIVRPGVCTSTTRPASPYDGQMIYETDTNLVKVYEGAAWVTVGPTTAGGLVVVKAETAFSGATTVTADGVFTSAFTNYRVLITYATVTPNNLFFALGAATVYANTNYNSQRLLADNTTVTAVRAAGAVSANIGNNNSGTVSSVAIDLFGPQLAAPTTYQASGNLNTGAFAQPVVNLHSGNQSDSTAFDGFKLISGGNITGSYTIYGYAKTV